MFQTEQCTRCLREVSPADPDARYKHGQIIACGSCTESTIGKKRLTSAERHITLSTARRYARRFDTSYILGDSIKRSAWLYNKVGNTHKVIAEIPPII